MGVVKDLGLLLFGHCPCVSDWRGAIIDNCTTGSCGMDTAICNLIIENEEAGEKEREGGRGEELKVDNIYEFSIIIRFHDKNAFAKLCKFTYCECCG